MLLFPILIYKTKKESSVNCNDVFLNILPIRDFIKKIFFLCTAMHDGHRLNLFEDKLKKIVIITTRYKFKAFEGLIKIHLHFLMEERLHLIFEIQ